MKQQRRSPPDRSTSDGAQLTSVLPRYAMPCQPVQHTSMLVADELCLRPDAGEVLSGVLDLMGQVGVPGHRRVLVRVYRTSHEHFAVLLPCRALATARKPLASLNLKTCAILQTSLDEFRVSPRPLEGGSLCFRSPPGSPSVARWIAALQEQREPRKRCPGSPMPGLLRLPALLEREEEVSPVC